MAEWSRILLRLKSRSAIEEIISPFSFYGQILDCSICNFQSVNSPIHGNELPFLKILLLYVVSPGLFHHLIRCKNGRLAKTRPLYVKYYCFSETIAYCLKITNCISYKSRGSSLVSLEVFPQHNLLIVQTTAILCHSIFFISPLFLFIQSRISKSVVICPFCSFLCSFVLSFLSILLFSTLLSIPCSVFSLFIHFIFWSPLFSFQICYSFFSLFLILCFACFSLMLYYYSICSLSISLHLFRSPYLILLCYLFCSCFSFLYTSSFW